ncbi:MAG: hypothetical protein IT373_14785 [Polyangiaceae bacterium]|nr:hypothetical protein [Polyangiaceae bacterium]
MHTPADLATRAARRTILARRTALLGSALATLGACRETAAPLGGTATASGPAPSVMVPSVSPSAAPEPSTALPEPSATASSPTPSAAIPKIVVPPDASPEMRERYAALEQELARTVAGFDRADALVPRGCSVLDASCLARWRALVDARKAADPPFGRYRVPPCPDAAPEKHAYHEQALAVVAYRVARAAAIDAAVSAELAPRGEAAEKRYGELESDWQMAHPMPCLSMPACTR